MEFGWTEEEQRYRDAVVAFAQRELGENLIQRDAEGLFSREAWNKCARFGIQGLLIPKEYGGQGADALRLVLAMEALGYGCRDNGLLFSISAQICSCVVAILKFGTEPQKRRYLPGLSDGSLIAGHAITEAESGSDAFSLTSTAERVGDRFRLNGRKVFVCNGPVADVFVVFASTDPRKRFAGISAFLIDRSAPGLRVGKTLNKMGLRTGLASELELVDCDIPAENMLGQPGAGTTIFNSSMDWERSLIMASAVGGMARQLDRCIDYAKRRQQFGRAIGSFQAVSHRIAEMKVRLETSRLLLYHVGWLKREGKSALLESAITKLVVSEGYVQSSLDALQIHGGSGYKVESELEREVRDAIGSRIYSGTSDIQRNLIASRLGL
ncbi:MAG: acyl-CoA dehydrogenase family protein [Nitrospirota bacterium]